MSELAIHVAWDVLQSVRPALPRRQDLSVELDDANAAQARGYYLPDEDERLRLTYLRYLGARASLWQMVEDLQPSSRNGELRTFALAFCAASMLMRSATFIIALAKERPIAWAKLDEAEPRYGLPRKSFTKVYQSFSSPGRIWRYHHARKFYEKHRTKILDTLNKAHMSEMIPWLEEEEPHFHSQKRSLLARLLSYRLYSAGRRTSSGYTKVMFHLFRLSGSAIAEMKQPFIKAPGAKKRVTAEIREEVRALLKPGDIFVTRHDDALSNLFLPGFWPHAALYLGPPEERRALGVPEQGDSKASVLEAKKDGVKFRPLSETLAVDAFVVLRPKASATPLKEVLTRALSHEGKLYDFLFDFRKADRLACTEVIYRSFHGIGDWKLELTKRAGRTALSAEDLIHQGLSQDLLEVILIFGIDGSSLQIGTPAKASLLKSLSP